MKVLVAVKRVVDYNVRVRVRADGLGVETEGVKHAINPFDEIALEEAVRLKEKGIATEVVVVALGPDAVQETLRFGLSLGADRAIHIACDMPAPLGAAKLLKAVVGREQPQLVLLGKQAIDSDAGQTGPMLAGLLGWAQASFASSLEINGNEALVTREVDAGLSRVRFALPGVVTADLRLNTPRHPTLPNIMKAKSKPLARITPEELGVALEPSFPVLKVAPPPTRQKGVRVASVEELVQRLQQEAKVI